MLTFLPLSRWDKLCFATKQGGSRSASTPDLHRLLPPVRWRQWLWLCLLAMAPLGGWAQCPTGVVFLRNQAQVDAFPVGCVNLTGQLTISGADITDLSSLSALQSTGILVIKDNQSLTSLRGLDNLGRVPYLIVQGNAQLLNLQGLNKLETAPVIDVISNPKLISLSQLGSLQTTSFLTIQDNAELLSLQGLDQLQTVKADIALYNNPKLTSLRGLESLRTVVGKISLQGNTGLTSLQGLNQIQSAGGLDFRDNAKLTSLSELASLSTVPNTISLQGNTGLTSLQGLNQIQSVGGLDFRNNAKLTSLSGLESLSTVGGGITIQGHAELASLQGLNQLQSAGGLDFRTNPKLTSLSGLASLSTVGGGITIQGNAELTSLQGLNQLQSAGGLDFRTNPKLSICANPSICSLLAQGVPSNIQNNAPGCNSVQDIQADCSPLAIVTQPPSQSIVTLCGTVTSAISASISTRGNVRTYQWYKDGQPVRGQTTNTLSLTSVQSSDQGTYGVVISNSVSSLTSTAFSLRVNPTSLDQPSLVDLYNRAGGANWTNKTGWLTGCTPCSWYGVTCDGNGQVMGLNLIKNNLAGTLPASLSALTSLRSLELGANALTGGIPSGIGSLTALQTLNLSRTQLGGTIPASLGQLTQLQNLLLNESALTGSLPASLGNLTQLQNLQLYSNQLSGCFPGNYTSLCGRAQISFTGNPNLPGGGDFAAFCSNGTGSELVISQAPSSATACVGSPFSFSFVARGAASYQWYREGQRLAESGPVLSFSAVSAADAGTYQVYINYACRPGAVQSDYFTLTVRSDGACPASDLVPLLYVSPGLVYGPSSVSVIVSVVNVGGLATRGSITLRISRDPMLPLSLPASATAVGSRTVQNALWSLDSSDPDVYVLRSSQVLRSGSQLSVGLVGSLGVGNTRGQLSVSAVLESGSGGEVRITNNTDAEKMDYFNK